MSQGNKQAQAQTQAQPDPSLSNNLLERSLKVSQWRDIPCIFIFAVFLIGFIIIASLDLRDYTRTQCFSNRYGDPRVVFFDPQILAIIAICILLTFVLSGLYFCVAAMYTSHFILVSMLLQIIVSLGCSIFYLAQSRWLSGTFSMIWLFVSALVYWIVRVFIRTATVQLNTAMRVTERNPTIIFISFLGALFCAAWSILMGSVTLAGFGKAVTEDCSRSHMLRPEGAFLALLAYLAMSNYLVTEVVKAAVRVSICHTFGWWCSTPERSDYLDGPVDSEGGYPVGPYATWMGLIGACTFSFGSICLSSLWLATVKLLAQVVSAWSQMLIVNSTDLGDKDVSIILLAWTLSNCVSQLDSALTHFTNYVLVFVAVDNQPYFEAFKRSFSLVVHEGINAITNDCLASGTLTFGAWCIGTLVALAAFVYMRWIQPYPQEGIFFVCSYIMLISIQICSILTTPISSGAQTLFVVMANEPNRLEVSHPDVYNALNACSEAERP